MTSTIAQMSAAAVAAVASVLATPVAAQAQSEQAAQSTPRGLTGSIEFSYDGPLLRAKPEQAITAPIVARLLLLDGRGLAADASGPRRYRIDYIGTVAGRHDLRALVETADGTPIDRVEAAARALDGLLVVEIVSELPPGHGSDLFTSANEPPPLSGSYRLILGALACAWLAVPAIVLVRRRLNRPRPIVVEPPPPPPTLADQLRPLVERALAEQATTDDLARLELLLVEAARRTAGIDATSTAAAIALLRSDPASRTLLEEVERWLHAPRSSADGPTRGDAIERLLAPWRNAAPIAIPTAREAGR
jgi:hypothetical protein